MKSKLPPPLHHRIEARGLLLGSWSCSLLLLAANLHAGSYQVGVAPSTVKVMIQGAAQTPPWPFEGTITNRYDLYLARGEHEAMQVVVIATDALTNAHVAVSAPQEVHGAGPLAGEAKAWLVGHVDVTDSPNPAEVDPSYLPNYYGWFPDPLLTFTNTCNIKATERVAFWIDMATLREATAGDYVANITVTADSSPTTDVQLNIHVWDFQLPLKASLPTAFSFSATGGAASLYDSAFDALGIEQQVADQLLDHRMGMTHLYGGAVESFDSISYWASRGGSAFNLNYLNANNKTVAQLTNQVKAPALKTLVDQVRGAGLLGMSYIYGFDESDSGHFADLETVFYVVHSTHPGLRTMTTAHNYDYTPGTGLWDAVDIWVPVMNMYNQDAANKLRADGKSRGVVKDMWWYICFSPYRSDGYINFMVEHRAIEPRLLMGLMSYKLQTGGFLYYQTARWLTTFHPVNGWIKTWPYTDWDPRSYAFAKPAGTYADGDGSLFCAGPAGPIPTIRMENIRDGLEDYEYLKLLENLVKTMSAISPLTAEQIAWTNSAQQLLAVPSNLVASMTSYTHDSTALESYREQLANAILTGQVLTAPPRPRLTIAPASAGNARLLWPTNAAGFNLEACTNLSATIWSNVVPAPVVIGSNNVVTNAMPTTGRFYRLRK